MYSSGRPRGGSWPHPILGKKEEIIEGRKAGREAKQNHPPPLLTQVCSYVLMEWLSSDSQDQNYL